MLLLSLACLAVGAVLATKKTEEREMYAPKGYMATLASRPRSVYAYAW